MGAWSVAIVDSGVTNETEARYGASVFDYDYYGRDGDTDGGRTTSHGSLVAQSAEMTNGQLERLDLQISNNSGSTISSTAIRNALNDVNNLANEGWHIGAVNMSFGGWSSYWTSYFRSQIAILHNQRIFSVAASGNGGTDRYLESPYYPARFSNVLSVGSHDGAGNPSWFSQNSSGGVHVLADGEDFPGQGYLGTSFATPQVTATVTTMQALVEASTGTRLSFDEVVDGLQQGGAGPRSAVDPSDQATTYYLLDHDGSANYVLATHVDPNISWLEYIASYSDLETAFGRDTATARDHFIHAGVWEGRSVSFDSLEYIASYADLRTAFGTDREAAASHYLNNGRYEGRGITFDADEYMAANPDIAAAFSGNRDMATAHYITAGAAEGRSPGNPGVIISAPSHLSEADGEFGRNAEGAGHMIVGQSASGTIGTEGDRDWYAVELTANETVVVQVHGASGDGSALSDPDLYVYDSDGGYVAYDFDSGAGHGAYLAFTATISGTYYLEVDGHFGQTGGYDLDLARATGASMDDLAAGLDPDDREPGSFADVQVALLSDGQLSTDPFGLL